MDAEMKICIFGKYPPIQGGVSMRTYWAAHGLARLGHTVHVVTNANEVALPYRMFMRDDDWARCNGQYGPGLVQVHWTEPYGGRQWHIPNGAPFITKLASLGLELAHEQNIDLIYSHYVEPYGIAGHIVAQATHVPHALRTAGTDAGRLWCLPQFAALYSHLFRCADAVICGPSVARKMVEAGVEPTRIALKPAMHVDLVGLFDPDGPSLDIAALRDQILNGENDEFRSSLFGRFDPSLTYFGVYGKLGRAKGTYSLLAALKRMRDHGLHVGLLAMAHEHPAAGHAFRKYVIENGLEERVCQLPFLPHWRVPEFIRKCVAICCLEQDFPIKFHDPVVAREVLTCGGCLVGSAEIIQKLPHAHKLRDGHNCVMVKDINDIEDLERRLTAILESPARMQSMRCRARQFAIEIETDSTRWLESHLYGMLNSKRRTPCNSRQRADHYDKDRPTAGADELIAT
jgi:glycosyltransferase involved in cell wall biosynthesis